MIVFDIQSGKMIQRCDKCSEPIDYSMFLMFGQDICWDCIGEEDPARALEEGRLKLKQYKLARTLKGYNKYEKR